MHSSCLHHLTDLVYPMGGQSLHTLQRGLRTVPCVPTGTCQRLARREKSKGSWPYLVHVASPAQKWQLLLPIQLVVSVATIAAGSPDK